MYTVLKTKSNLLDALMEHPIESFLKRKIGDPTYVREVFLDEKDSPDIGYIKMWMPYFEKDKYWSCLTQFSWIDSERHYIATSDDEIGAILSLFYMIRAIIDESKRNVYYKGYNKGGFPLWSNLIISDNAKLKVENYIREIDKFEIDNLKF